MQDTQFKLIPKKINGFYYIENTVTQKLVATRNDSGILREVRKKTVTGIAKEIAKLEIIMQKIQDEGVSEE